MSEQADYVLLTGGKNNCGDFLIKHRAKELLKTHRPDRSFLDWNAWVPLSQEQLNVINRSKALVLTGGPAIQPTMYPNVYPLVEDLNKIEVPIISFGLGSKPKSTLPESAPDVVLTKPSRLLLSIIDNCGYRSSVRDFATLRLLEGMGLRHFMMTGCPALFEPHPMPPRNTPNGTNIIFSTGVYFAINKSLERQMKDIVMELNSVDNATLTVAFHHSLGQEYLATHNANTPLLKKQRELAEWLADRNIDFKDISGGEKAMLSLYSKADIHVGYRVHAHILMSSWGKPSILISEDGRSTALSEVIGGLTIDAFRTNVIFSAIKSLTKNRFEIVARKTDGNAPANVKRAYLRIKSSHDRSTDRISALIRIQEAVMKEFLQQLP